MAKKGIYYKLVRTQREMARHQGSLGLSASSLPGSLCNAACRPDITFRHKDSVVVPASFLYPKHVAVLSPRFDHI